jgi:hypothetical protein
MRIYDVWFSLLSLPWQDSFQLLINNFQIIIKQLLCFFHYIFRHFNIDLLVSTITFEILVQQLTISLLHSDNWIFRNSFSISAYVSYFHRILWSCFNNSFFSLLNVLWIVLRNYFLKSLSVPAISCLSGYSWIALLKRR